ncbi:MAG: hypothetical protein Q4A78_12370 [Peptostreptococcaceae bacterium]|nr:hypothetical protein [Peptostreptococcaceae bacterium]
MTMELKFIISTAVSLLGVYFAFLRISKDSKDAEERRREKETERHIELKLGMENIAQTVNALSSAHSSTDSTVKELDRRVTVVEESAKSAHKRIDANTHCMEELRRRE